MKTIEAIFFFTPYRLFKNDKEGISVLVKCTLLFTSNVLTVINLYFIATGAELPDLPYSKGDFRIVGLLSLIPFLVFFLLMKKKYTQKFATYVSLPQNEYEMMNRISGIYIYTSIALVFSSLLIVKLIQIYGKG